MRHGHLIATLPRGEADPQRLAELMVGRPIESPRRARPTAACEAVLCINDLRGDQHATSGSALRGVTLTVGAGEIVGVVGVAGNGQRELAETIIGLHQPDQGQIELHGSDISRCSPRERFTRGLACVDEDPRRTALLLSFSVSWNVALRSYAKGPSRSSVDYAGMRELTKRLIEAFDVRGATPDTPVGHLSGGNQQKVLLARELELDPSVLLVVNPTVGLDIAAAAAIHEALREHRDQGAAILLISTDLDEAEALSDRLAVIYRGRIAGLLSGEPDRRRVGMLMAGVHVDGGELVGVA
jgi:simple sugar transport system ATP-binding protein